MRNVGKVGASLKRWCWLARKSRAGKCRDKNIDLTNKQGQELKVKSPEERSVTLKKTKSCKPLKLCWIPNNDVSWFTIIFSSCFILLDTESTVKDLLLCGVWIREGTREMTQRIAIKATSLQEVLIRACQQNILENYWYWLAFTSSYLSLLWSCHDLKEGDHQHGAILSKELCLIKKK